MTLLFGLNKSDQKTEDTSAHFITKKILAPINKFIDTSSAQISSTQPTTSFKTTPEPINLNKFIGSSIGTPSGKEISSTNPKAALFAPIEDLPWYKRPARAINDSIKNQFNDLNTRFNDLADSMSGLKQGEFQKTGEIIPSGLSTKQQNIDRTTKFLSVGLGMLNSALLPITVAFQTGEQIPTVGDLFKKVNTTFSKTGEIGGEVSNYVTDKLPVSNQTKESLRPVLTETFSLLSQMALGKIAHDIAKPKLESLESKTREILKPETHLAIVEAEKNTNRVAQPIETKQTQINTPNTTEIKLSDIKDIVDTSVKQGIKEKSLEYFRKNPETITENPIKIREVDGKLVIEDGRHRIQIANELGIKNIPIEDVTPQYTGSASSILNNLTTRLTQIEGTGELKTSGLASNVERSAIERQLTKGFGDLPEYKVMNIKEQAKLASDLINTDYEKAKRIALGQEASPQGIHPEAIYTAVETRATKQGDVNTLRDLAVNSHLTSEATTMGQRIKLLDERNDESPVKAIRELSKKREEVAKKKYKNLNKEIEKTANEIDGEIKKIKFKKQTWVEFVKSIQC